MRFLLVGGSVGNYQFERLKEEAEKLGHVLDRCASWDLAIDFHGNEMQARSSTVDLASYDLVRYLAIGKNRHLWLTAGELLRKRGMVIVDERPFLLTSSQTSATAEYMKTVALGLPLPRSVATRSMKMAIAAAESIGFPCIVKTTNSRKGRGVGLVKNEDEVRDFVSAHLTREGISVVVREFIPNEGDIRVFIMGGKAIGALARRPKPGDFRANISQGGSGDVFDLGARPDVREIAEKMAAACGLAIAGVDIMLSKETGAPYVLEVNESPQIEGFEKYTGVNAAKAMIEYFEGLVKKLS
jgi:RimK family alpha-L-glutamate ligase